MLNARHTLRRWMTTNGLNQAELADRLGVTQGAVSQLLTETTKVPSLKIATAIRDVVGIETDAWLPPRRRTRRAA